MRTYNSFNDIFAGNVQVAPLPSDMVRDYEQTYKTVLNPMVYRATSTENYQGTTDGAGATALTSAGISLQTAILILQMRSQAWMLPGFTLNNMIVQAGVRFTAEQPVPFYLSATSPQIVAGQIDFVRTAPANLAQGVWEHWYNPPAPILTSPLNGGSGSYTVQAFGAAASTYRFQFRVDIDFCLATPLQ